MAKIHPDLQVGFIPIKEAHKHIDQICPPEKRRVILRDMYKQNTPKMAVEVRAIKKAG